MRDYPIIDTHAHTFPTREVGRQAIQALPHPGPPGVVQDLPPGLTAAGFARALMLNFTPAGEMREGNLVREATGTAPAQWGVLEEQVRQSIVGRGIDPRMAEDGMLADGRVIADCPRAEVRRDPQGREIYLGA